MLSKTTWKNYLVFGMYKKSIKNKKKMIYGKIHYLIIKIVLIFSSLEKYKWFSLVFKFIFLTLKYFLLNKFYQWTT